MAFLEKSPKIPQLILHSFFFPGRTMMVAPLWNWIFFDVSVSCWRLCSGECGEKYQQKLGQKIWCNCMQYKRSNVDFPCRGFEMEIAALGRCTNISVGCTPSARDFVWIRLGNSFCAGTIKAHSNRHIYIPSGKLTNRHGKSPSFPVNIPSKCLVFHGDLLVCRNVSKSKRVQKDAGEPNV